MSKKVLVTGATGTIGGFTVPQLIEKGLSVRVFVRNAEKAAPLKKLGAELFIGEFSNTAQLDAAMTGVDAVLSITPPAADGYENASAITQAAKKAGVKQFVRVSVIGAAKDGPTDNVRQHFKTDEEIIASGLTYTLLRPNFFMQNIFMSVPSIGAEGNMYWGMGEGKIGMIDARDIADAATSILVNGGHENKIYPLCGATSIDFSEVAAVISKGLGKQVNYIAVPPVAVRESLISMGMGEWFGQVMMDYSKAYSEGWGDILNDNMKLITGNPSRSFQEFFNEVMVGAFQEKATA